jgi:hypothetical protein
VSIVITERFGLRESTHDARGLERAAEHATEELAERTVWCAGSAPDGRACAHELRACLQRAGGLRATGDLDLDAEHLADDVRRVGADDVVVLHDLLSAALTGPLREQGAHPVWHLRPDQLGGRAWAALARHAAGVDGCIISWSQQLEGDTVVERAVAVIPAASVVATTEVRGRRRAGDAAHELAWRRALAGVVSTGHAQHVGGTLHARPSVAPR